MKQFGRTILTIMGLVVAAAVLSSIPARASGPSKHVTANGLGGFVQIFDSSNPDDPVFAFVSLSGTANSTGYTLFYSINDSAGTVNDFGFGSIPASSVNVSGGSIHNGKTVITLNVNTCDVAEFIANNPGPCGPFDITWTELPASLAGSFAERANIVTTFPNGEKMIQNGPLVGFSAQVTGTAFGYSNTGGPAFGSLTQATNVIITFNAP